jgi:transposase
MTKADRQHIAKHLYGKKEWTMEQIGQALDVSKKTISLDLKEVVTEGNNPARPKGGRPKGSGKSSGSGSSNGGGRPRRSKFGEDVETKVACAVLDQGKSYEAAGAEFGVSNIVVRPPPRRRWIIAAG